MISCSITSAKEDQSNCYLTVTGMCTYRPEDAKSNGTYAHLPKYGICIPITDIQHVEEQEFKVKTLKQDTKQIQYTFTVNFGNQDGADSYKGPFIITILSDERKPLDTVILPIDFCEKQPDQTITFDNGHAAYVCNASDFHSLSEAQ